MFSQSHAVVSIMHAVHLKINCENQKAFLPSILFYFLFLIIGSVAGPSIVEKELLFPVYVFYFIFFPPHFQIVSQTVRSLYGCCSFRCLLTLRLSL